MPIIRPKLIALDSSHWAQWAWDSFSPDSVIRSKANAFEQALLDGGYSVLVTMHHLVELIAVENRELAARRLRFMRGRQLLSWIGVIISDDRILGNVTDLFAAELTAVLEGRDLLDTRQYASQTLLRFGSGEGAIPGDPQFLPLMLDWTRKQSERARTITAIDGWRVLPQSMKVGDLMSGRMRTQEELRRALVYQSKALTAEIESHGDRRIDDAAARALQFMQEMLALKASFPDKVRELIAAGYQHMGIDEDEIDPGATIGDLDDLGKFRSQIRVAADMLGLDFTSVKRRVNPEQFPHRVVIEAVSRHRLRRDRREGGDLYDRYLVSLSPYTDVVMTDKRTHADFEQARRRVPALTNFTGRVERAANYCDIMNLLAAP